MHRDVVLEGKLFIIVKHHHIVEEPALQNLLLARNEVEHVAAVTESASWEVDRAASNESASSVAATIGKCDRAASEEKERKGSGAGLRKKAWYSGGSRLASLPGRDTTLRKAMARRDSWKGDVARLSALLACLHLPSLPVSSSIE